MVMPYKIKKRDGRIVKFDQQKITRAISKSLSTVHADMNLAKKLSDEVVEAVKKRFRLPTVENVQDVVEKTLIKNNLAEAARAYILYRQKHAEMREAKKIIGVKDELKLGINALQVLRARYLMKDAKGNIIETPSQMFRRVAKAVAAVEKRYKKNPKKAEDEFYNAMANLEFLPNSPTLMNAGTKKQMLSACFALPIGDSLESIFQTLKDMAKIEQVGGGVGFSFSRLRPKGDIVGSTKGTASGPISFMRVYDMATEVIKQGSRRRGAMIGILNVDHPDILDFIKAKEQEGVLKNFNISVAVNDNFMKAVARKKPYNLVNPRDGKKTGKLKANDIFDWIATNAWATGDPGLIFIDEINRKQPTPKVGKIDTTNPCGEIPLLPYESCNLGSINLSKLVVDGKIDWEKLGRLVHLGVNFLDNVVDANKFPLREIEDITRGNRKIGLGIMGFAEMLIQLDIPYNSKKALSTAEKLMKFIKKEALAKSIELAKKRGSFPNFKKSNLAWKYKALRNATLLSIAPTGTISIIAQTSSSIEPLFALSFVREILEGAKLLEVNQFFEKAAKEFFTDTSPEIMSEIAKKGTIQDMKGIPEKIRKLFVTAMDIPPEWHVRMQAAFQKHVDNAVSKTINLPPKATVGDVKKAFMAAYKLKCKGITIYRYGSKKEQVLCIGGVTRKGEIEEHVRAHAEYSGGCPTIECPF